MCIFSVHSLCDVHSNTAHSSHSTRDKARPWWQLLGMSHPFLNMEHWSQGTFHTAKQTQHCSPKGIEESHDYFCSAHKNRAHKGADSGIHYFKQNDLNLSKFHKTLMEQSSSSRLLLQEPQNPPFTPYSQ